MTMDVELQILKHLKRDAQPTVSIIDQYCEAYIELVLADSLYGEASSFITTLNKYQIPWVLAIRNNHGVWMPAAQKLRANKWCEFERIFSNQQSETRYIREIIYGKRRGVRSRKF